MRLLRDPIDEPCSLSTPASVGVGPVLNRMLLVLRSLAFTVLMGLSITVFATLIILTLGLPALEGLRFKLGHACARFELWLLRLICGLDYVIEGRANLPGSGGILFWRHESAWETFLSIILSPRPTWVLKRELYWIPIVGWAIALLRPIAINRGAHRHAVKQIMKKGAAQISAGRTLNFFPEGTRLAPGERRRYGLSGALLAQTLGRPVVPVAHNAGDFWKRRGWIKQRGVIRVRIGPPMEISGSAPEAFNLAIQRWIEAALTEIRAPH